LNWDVSAPQKELFPSAEQNIESEVPSDAHLTNLPLNHLSHAEDEITPEETANETAAEATPEEGFVLYNLDEAPEPQDLTPEAPHTSETAEPAEPQSQPSVQPSREAFAERQRQITRNLADFKSKLNLPGRIADLENEPAYKRRNISIDDTPHSSESKMSRFQLNEEVDAEGNRRFELRDDNSFLHDNVD
jgi:cell division protein FtsZ